MLNAWALILGFIGVIVMIIIPFVRIKKEKKRSVKKSVKLYANTTAIRDLPEYKSAKKKYHFLIAGLIAVLALSIVSASVISARPASVTVLKPSYENRDIMFCIDVSGSMDEYIAQLLTYFSKVMPKFEGQRVGITVFDGVYMTLSPLSDDYIALSELFSDVSENPGIYRDVISAAQKSSSEIGPGLVGCVNSFDKLDEEDRSRAIIFTTDNFASTTQAVSLQEAANYAKRYDIAVYGLSTSDFRSQFEIDNMDEDQYESSRNKEFRESMLATGGAYYSFSQYSDEEIAVKQIAERILEQSAARHEGADTLVYSDSPLIPSIIAVISIALLFVIIWRLGL